MTKLEQLCKLLTLAAKKLGSCEEGMACISAQHHLSIGNEARLMYCLKNVVTVMSAGDWSQGAASLNKTGYMSIVWDEANNALEEAEELIDEIENGE